MSHDQLHDDAVHLDAPNAKVAQLNAHNALTVGPHGIADTAQIVLLSADNGFTGRIGIGGPAAPDRQLYVVSAAIPGLGPVRIQSYGQADGLLRDRVSIEGSPVEPADMTIRNVALSLGSIVGDVLSGGPVSLRFVSPVGASYSALVIYRPGDVPGGGTERIILSSAGTITLKGIGTNALNVQREADTNQRFRIQMQNGQLDWGSGSALPDVNLYRSAADVLKTDDAFEAASLKLGTGPVITALPRIFRKTIDQLRNNDIGLVNDNEILVPVEANGVYWIEVHALFNSSTVADFKANFSVPSGSYRFGRMTAAGVAAGSSPGEWGVGSVSVGGQGADSLVVFGCLAVIGATPGNVIFRWAQNTAEVSDTKVLAHSWVEATRLA